MDAKERAPNWLLGLTEIISKKSVIEPGWREALETVYTLRFEAALETGGALVIAGVRVNTLTWFSTSATFGENAQNGN